MRASGLPRFRAALRLLPTLAVAVLLAGCGQRTLIISGLARQEDGKPAGGAHIEIVVTHKRPLSLPPAVEVITARADLQGRFERTIEYHDAEFEVTLKASACRWSTACIHYGEGDLFGYTRVLPVLKAKPAPCLGT